MTVFAVLHAKADEPNNNRNQCNHRQTLCNNIDPILYQKSADDFYVNFLDMIVPRKQ